MNRYSGIREVVKIPDTLANSLFISNFLQMTKKIIDQV